MTLNIVAQIIVRNEADIAIETLAEITHWGVKTVSVLDGGSDDGTLEVIRAFAESRPDVVIDLVSRPDPGGRFADHYRNELLKMTARHRPDWVISVDADEIYDTSPVEAILAAEAAGAGYIWNDVPQFWLTFDDIRNGALVEDETVSIQERRRWYTWGHTGVFIWKWHDKHYYPPNAQKRTPETRGPEKRLYGPVRPICKHYCIRTIRQGVKRIEERKARGGIEYFDKYFYSVLLVDETIGLHRLGTNGVWNKTYNHDKIFEWFDMTQAAGQVRVQARRP